MAKCRRCGGEVVQKSRIQLAAVGALMIASMASVLLPPHWWWPAILLGLTGAYLLAWATAGRGRWCRGCKRFDGVSSSAREA